MRLSCVQELSSPEFVTVFPKTEEMLTEDRYELSLSVQAWCKKISKYNSWVDFLFIEMFPQWKDACAKFYKGKGPSVEEDPHMTQEIISCTDDFLCKCLELAYERTLAREGMSWNQFAKLCYKFKPAELTYRSQYIGY